MDTLEMWEVQILYDNLQYSNADVWETTRMLGYMIAAPYMKEKKSISDFFPLPWDKEAKEEHNYTITDDEISKLKEESKYFEKLLNDSK